MIPTVIGFNFGDNCNNYKYDGAENSSNEPEWTDNDDFFDGRNVIKVLDGVFGLKNADSGRVLPFGGIIVGGFWHDELDIWVLFARVD